MKVEGQVFLIPNTLGPEISSDTIPSGMAEKIRQVEFIFVEHAKEARRLLISIGLKDRLDHIEMAAMGKHLSQNDLNQAENLLKEGKSIGVLSDAGCPGIADPGNEVVSIAHKLGARVIPLTGPSSLMLGLMASGFNGQKFAFHGYLPKDQNQRRRKIREIEKNIYQNSETQIFIETPYRNQHLFSDLLSECQKNTKICLALNLTFPDEEIKVDSVENFKKQKWDLDKKQCLFLMYK